MKNNLSKNGIVKDACLVSFHDAAEEHKGKRILSATVVKDFNRRWERGDWMLSSLVKEVNGDHVYTMNSIYQVEGELDQVILSVSDAPALRKGISPHFIKASKEQGVEIIDTIDIP